MAFDHKNRGFYARGFVGAVRELPLQIGADKIRGSYDQKRNFMTSGKLI